MSTGMNSRLQDYFDTADEALHGSIRDGDLEHLQQLLHALPAPNIEYSHPGFGPPVHFAAWCGNLDAVDQLLAAGANPRLASHDGLRLTAIGHAALKGHRHVVKRLWKLCAPEDHLHGVKPAQTCLVLAATIGNVAVVEDLLDQWDDWLPELKTEALLWASRRWHFAVVALLLSRATFKQPTIQEALHLAAVQKIMLYTEINVKYEGIDYINQQQLIALLIDAGADPNLCPNNTPLVYTIAHDINLTGALKTLLERAQTRTRPTELTAIRLLLQHGASVSQPDNQGESPLHWAAFGLDLRLFRLYLSSSLDQGQDSLDSLLQLTSPNGESLLHFAAAGGCIKIIEFLLAQGLNINAKNSNGWTPLMCALAPKEWNPSKSVKSPADMMRVARFLLSHCTDGNVTTDEGWTPLMALQSIETLTQVVRLQTSPMI